MDVELQKLWQNNMVPIAVHNSSLFFCNSGRDMWSSLKAARGVILSLASNDFQQFIFRWTDQIQHYSN
jgi:hypothetical protein